MTLPANKGPFNFHTMVYSGGALTRDLLSDWGIEAVHITNGIFGRPANLILPTNLSAFEFVRDQETDLGPAAPPALVIAVNSDMSVRLLAEDLRQRGDHKSADILIAENQFDRAVKIGHPIAQQHPDRIVLTAFYDERTPNTFFEALSESRGNQGKDKLRILTLTKGGWGVDANSKDIEGARFVEKVYGYPNPNEIKPLCWAVGERLGAHANQEVIDLRQPVGRLQRAYLTPDNKCLFGLNHSDLERYAAGPQRGAVPKQGNEEKPTP